MADIRLVDVSKQFGAVSVLENISMDIRSGEFIVFLGPSGCGKSTLLRMIAGLETTNGGEIHIGERRVDQLPANQREVAMVFQNYALYPHMTVKANMSFGLVNIRMPKPEIERRVAEAARILEIEQLLARKPAELSGGQRQRVAIGRAIVRDPKVFLLDEPLSNLDAGLRVRTRVELAQLHNRIDATMIFVTHDQTEAMTLASRIVVMNNRRIEQIGTPMDIYSQPASRFVASFVGSPAMNFIDVRGVSETGGMARVALDEKSYIDTKIPVNSLPDGPLSLGIRAEAIKVAGESGAVSGKAEIVERLGERTLVHVRLSNDQLVIAEDIGRSMVDVGMDIKLEANGEYTHLFDEQGAAYHAVA